MKKLHLVMRLVGLSYAALVLYCIMMLTGCAASHSHCDAYGQANYSQNQDTASK